MPEPYHTIIKQLAKLWLNSNKITFTLDEVKMAYPDITVIPGAITGFCLLKAIQHYNITTKSSTAL